MSFLEQVVVYLAAATIAVPLFHRFKLSDVLGYLAIGVVLGPWGIAFVSDPEQIMEFAELGVVFLLFIIGLELNPARLWVFRRYLINLGATQVFVVGTFLAILARLLGVDWAAGFVIGFALALSSTAFVLQFLRERNHLMRPHGRAAFGVLLFQDIAIIPLLGIMYVMAPSTESSEISEVILQVVSSVGLIAAFILFGHFLLRPVFRLLAEVQIREAFLAGALLLVLGSALLMEHAGMTMAFGAFLAGVLLADSEYRHQLEADIAPFKGLLLGLFFIAIGMLADLSYLSTEPLTVLMLVAILVGMKTSLIFFLGRGFKLSLQDSFGLGICLSQGGELAFVLLTEAANVALITQEIQSILVLVITLSIATTPILYFLYENFFQSLGDQDYSENLPGDTEIIIAGFGRFAQIIARVLSSKNIPFTAIEKNPSQVEFVRRFGNKIYFGDASDLDLLRAANTEQAKIFILAVDDVEDSLLIAQLIREYFPHLVILARARNRQHELVLRSLGVQNIVRETLHSSLYLTEKLLTEQGFSQDEAHSIVETFKQHDAKTLMMQLAVHQDEEALIQTTKSAAEELRALFDRDEQAKDHLDEKSDRQ